MGQTLVTLSKRSPAPSKSFDIPSHSESCAHEEKSSSPRVSNNLLLLPLEIRYEIYRYVFEPQVICIVSRYGFSKRGAKLDGLLKASALIRAEAFEVLYRMTLFRFHPSYNIAGLNRVPYIRAPWDRMQNVKIEARINDVASAFELEIVVTKLGACNSRSGTCWLTIEGGNTYKNPTMRFLHTINSLNGFKRVIVKLACNPIIWARTSSPFSYWCLRPDIAAQIVQQDLTDHYNEEMTSLLEHLKTGLGNPKTSHLITDMAGRTWTRFHLELEFHPQGSLPPGAAPLPASTWSRPRG